MGRNKMWLYLPSQFVAESEDSISGSECPEVDLKSELFVTLSGKPTARPLSWHGWKSRPWSKRLSGATSQPLMAIHGAGKWVASLGEYHASPTPVRERGLQKKTKETYGTMHGGSFAKWEQTSYSWRTLEALLTGECPEYSETWPTSGSMQNGVCSVAKAWEPPIGANVYSCWHTPAARDYRGRAAEGPYTNLAKDVHHWSTPGASDAIGTGNQSFQNCLKANVEKWSTPMPLREEIGRRSISPNLLQQVKNFVSQENNSSQDCGRQDNPIRSGLEYLWSIGRPYLNPMFVEWLMGFPRGWSKPTSLGTIELRRWEMLLAHQLPPSRGKRYGEDLTTVNASSILKE